MKATWTQAIAFEMEGGGVAAAAHQHHLRPSMLIIKGVCDRAAHAKNNKSQAYAADAAGRYAMGLLIEQGTPGLGTEPIRAVVRQKAARHDPWAVFGLTTHLVRKGLAEAFDTMGLRLLVQDLRLEWEEFENRSTHSGASSDLVREFERKHWEEDLLEASASAKPDLLLWAKVNDVAGHS